MNNRPYREESRVKKHKLEPIEEHVLLQQIIDKMHEDFQCDFLVWKI
jgi:hypothetical protein